MEKLIYQAKKLENERLENEKKNKLNLINNNYKITTNNNFKILITTHNKQKGFSLDILINNIEKNNIPKGYFIIVNGQSETEYEEYYRDIKIINVKYTGLHHTGMIHLLDNKNKYEENKYWVLLPDTIVFGKKFFSLINYYIYFMKKNNLEVLPFINPKINKTMDLAIYSLDYIISLKEYLYKIKTYKFNNDLLLKLKLQLFYDENIVLGITPLNKFKSTYLSTIIINKGLKIYITNNKDELYIRYIFRKNRLNNYFRSKEIYLKNLDLLKFERNHDLNNKLILE